MSDRNHRERRTNEWTLMAFALVSASIATGCSAENDEAKKYNPGVGNALDDASAANDAQTADVLAHPLCDDLGGYAGVRTISTAAIAALSQDCRIGAYFTSLSEEAKAHHADCFETYLAATSECAGADGKKITYLGSKDSHGEACKTIPQAHQALGLTRSDYNAFQEDIVAAMTTANIAEAARRNLLSRLNGQPGVYNNNKTGNPMCSKDTCEDCVPVRVDAGDGGNDGATEAGDAGTDGATGTDAAQDSAPMDAAEAG